MRLISCHPTFTVRSRDQMAFTISVPQSSGAPLTIDLQPGEQLYILGANGTGKSSLVHRINSSNRGLTRHVSAHRQNWFASSELTLSSQEKRQTENNMMQADLQPYARWRDDYSSQRAGIALYDLVDAENVRARAIADVVLHNMELARTLAEKNAPLAQINDLLQAANIPVKIAIRAGEDVRAVRDSGVEYGVSELSDGERNALLVAANILTAKPGMLILVDEPERHLHRSIISPLLTHLLAARPDCAFVISTHEVMLPVDNPAARTLLVRSCSYDGNVAVSWEADLLEAGGEIDEQVRRDILGARRTIIFVEGGPGSLDRPLYALLFPSASVVAKSSCRDVEQSVFGIRAGESLHWLRAFGVVDNDRRSAADIERLAERGIHALPVYSVESIYYHPDVQRRVAERHVAIVGGDAKTALSAATAAVIDAVTQQADRLAVRVAEKVVREVVFQNLPRQQDIAEGRPISITIDVERIVTAERERLRAAITAPDVNAIISRYPIRETQALNNVARSLGFQNRTQYEMAVLKLLADDASARVAVRSMFGQLALEVP